MEGYFNTPMKALENLKKVVARTNSNKTGKELMNLILDAGKSMMFAQNNEHFVQNILFRVLKIIREESIKLYEQKEKVTLKRKSKMLPNAEANENKCLDKLYKELKNNVVSMLMEYMREIENSIDNIAAQGIEHIHADEIVLTIGFNETVCSFLLHVATKRKFRVVVAEAAPSYSGHDMVKALVEGGIETTLINDSAIYCVMSRVNKVILGTDTVYANGGMKMGVGGHMTALSANQHQVPVYVLASVHQVSPLFQTDVTGEELQPNKQLSSESIMSFRFSGDDVTDQHYCDVINPLYDYLPPSLITLIISNEGGLTPLNLYSVIEEQYSRQDLLQYLHPKIED